jgi:hypothetical protein
MSSAAVQEDLAAAVDGNSRQHQRQISQAIVYEFKLS